MTSQKRFEQKYRFNRSTLQIEALNQAENWCPVANIQVLSHVDSTCIDEILENNNFVVGIAKNFTKETVVDVRLD